MSNRRKENDQARSQAKDKEPIDVHQVTPDPDEESRPVRKPADDSPSLPEDLDKPSKTGEKGPMKVGVTMGPER